MTTRVPTSIVGPGGQRRHRVVVLGGDARGRGRGRRRRGTSPPYRGGRDPARPPRPRETVDLPAPAGPSMAMMRARGAGGPVPVRRREVVGEPGVAGLDGAEPGDEAALAGGGGEGGHGGGHGHAVVAAAVEAGAAEVGVPCAGDAGDRQRVAVAPRPVAPKAVDHVDHRLQPIDFLDPQLPHVVEDRGALRRPRPPRPGRGSRRARGSRPRPPWWPGAAVRRLVRGRDGGGAVGARSSR